ncbi:hypothetical protein B0A52_09133 [Exophiala mesophila]|uniref:Uncharacterized protein n=1 Tax=Exophiala mesophila TaxID=212818 RepID=A0A438MWP2_EXOME|nr:hypothetical protein B0A52_09133 [Exophiala mesophila]
MSGVGEILAIVSCVAGLIQAYDAGARVVKQIKQRRQAHGALPPSDLLEESIEKGRVEITKMVEEGNKRFGPSFEEGDSKQSPRAPEGILLKLTSFTAIAQMALMRVTIATQQALLAGLTQARDDDGIIDFDDCIDTSDQGRNEALLALHALFQRKLEEDMQRKKLVTEQAQRAGESPKDLKPPPYQPQAIPSDSRRLPTSTHPTEPTPAANSNTRIKKSKTFSEVLFRRKSSNESPPKPTSTSLASKGLTQQISPQQSQQEIVHVNPVTRCNTTNSTTSNATWSSGSSGTSDVTLGRPTSMGRPNSIASSVGSPTRRDTAMSTISSMSSISGMTAISAVSSMSSLSTATHIAKYGGCCKYAYELREGKVKKALMLQVQGFYGTGGGRFVCYSNKCEFSGPALKDKGGYKMFDKALTARCGLRYHWLFLAKSHVQQLDSRYTSYRCLPCLLSREDSVIYHDEGELFEHLVEHQGTYLGNTKLEGRLKFTNHGAFACADSDSDIEYPEPIPAAPVESSEKEIAVVVSATVAAGRSKPEESRTPPPRTAYTYDEQPDDNPWL